MVERGAIWQNTTAPIKNRITSRRTIIIIEVHHDVQVIAQ